MLLVKVGLYANSYCIYLIFGSLVFFHELGHFIFAKRAGIMVREFAIGMGPKIFGMTKGETFIRSVYCQLVDMYVWLVRISIPSNYNRLSCCFSHK